jgi:hypothetical protein
MSFLEDDKEVEFGKPKLGSRTAKDARQRERQRKKRNRQAERKRNTPLLNATRMFLQRTGLRKGCEKCKNAKAARKAWEKEKRKRDRNWKT